MSVASAPAVETSALYSVGSLQYTKKGLIVLFAWLLWGDFCYTLMETVIPAILPLYLLGELGVSNKVTALLISIIPHTFGLFVGPAVSFKSDRYRGKWGRRIPFIVWTAPFLVVGLVGIGFANYFHQDMITSAWPERLHIHPMTAALSIIGFFIILFAFMNEFVGSVYYYLFADVVPEEFIGRFMSLFRLVGIGAGALFKAFIFQYSISHMMEIFIGAGLLYLLGFGAMCWKVKEGQYPPPDDLGEKPSVLKQCTVYVKECFGHPIYILVFLYTGLMAMAGGAMLGGIVFTRDALGITLAQIGVIQAVSRFISMGLAYPSGWLVDKVHPLRMMLLMQLTGPPLKIASFFLLTGYTSWLAFQGVDLIIGALAGAAGLPLLIRIFPKDKYGQYCSCNGMVKAAFQMVGALVGAWFIDLMTTNGTNKDAYRWMYIWGAIFQASAIVLLYIVYGMWKLRGGDTGYVAPGSAKEKEMLARKAAVAAGN